MRIISCLTTGRLSGVDVFAVHLTRGLTALGHEAEILLTEPQQRVADPLPLPCDVTVRRMPAMSLLLTARRRQWLREYLERRAPCVYLPNYDYRHSAVCAELPNDVVAVGHVHSDDPMHYDHARLLSPYWNATVAVSRETAKRALEYCPALGGTLTTIPYGVPAPQSPPRRHREAGQPLRVLYVGRIEQAQKRVLDLVPIVQRALDNGANVQLTVVGGGPALGVFLDRAQGLMQRGAVRLSPTAPNDQLAEHYRQADVLLLPSAFEGLPVALVEAMAAGCVPVVSDLASGVPELIDQGVEGFRVPVGDIAGFAARLCELAADPEKLAGMSRAAHDRLAGSPYTLERMVGSYAALFERLMDSALAGAYRRPQSRPGQLWLQGSWHGLSRRARRWSQRLLSGQAAFRDTGVAGLDKQALPLNSTLP